MFVVCRVSTILGGLLSFQCQTILSPAAKSIWDTITLIWVGNGSISSDRGARPVEGAIFIPVTCSIIWKMCVQNFSMRGHDHSMCGRFSGPPQFLQQSEDTPAANFDMRYKVPLH